MSNRGDLIPLKQVIDYLPTPVDYSTIWRWTQGVRGVKLAAVMVGGRLYTDQNSIEQFIAECKRRRLLNSQSQKDE